MPDTGKSKSEQIFVDPNSQGFKDLNIPLLLNSFIKIFKERITIITTSTFVADYLKGHTETLRKYFNKEEVQFIVKPPSDKEIFKEKDAKNKQGNEQNYTELDDNIGQLHGFINPDYVETPYLTGKSNEIAYAFAEKLLNKREGAIFYIYGETGTGKSHLLNILAYRALQQGQNVYLSNTNNFIDYAKESYFKNKKSFLNLQRKMDFTILDDFQYLNKNELKWIADPLFEIITQQINQGKTMVMTSDTPPNHAPPYFHERITNRLMSGYVCFISLPDKKMKRQYIEWFCKRNSLEISHDVSTYIMSVANNLRAVKGILGYCQVLNESGQMDIRKLVELTSKIYGDMSTAKKTTEKILHRQIYSLLMDHFGISQEDIKKVQDGDRKRKPTPVAIIDNITWYLLKDVVENESELKKSLNIKYNTEKYCFLKGKEAYDKIESKELKTEIAEIMSSSKKRQMSDNKQEGLWG